MSTHQIKLKQLRRLKFRNIFLNTVCILLALAWYFMDSKLLLEIRPLRDNQ